MISLQDKVFNINNRIVVALDGPAASGKGTIGRLLAQHFNLCYFQSSIFYRRLAWLCKQASIRLDDVSGIIQLSTNQDICQSDNDESLFDEDIGAIASEIATIPQVRVNLNKHQITAIHISHRVLMEGRDIGTVIAPDADLKIFITANLTVRAKRRFKQLQDSGKSCILRDILYQLESRDIKDQGRRIAPLVPARDALVIDSSLLTINQVLAQIEEFIKSN